MFPLSDLYNLVNDRLDGLSLLAEALSHSHHTGRMHDLMRVFERAFCQTSTPLIVPLSLFLTGTPANFTKDEVQTWLLRIRHPATHADRRNDFLLQSDVRKVTGRMQEAAYDVLLNKTVWRSVSCDRRNVWSPSAGSSSPDGGMFLTQGLDAKLEFQLLDDFGSFDRDMNGFFDKPLPEPWWTGEQTGEERGHSQSCSTGYLRVLPNSR
jgi:hypothetical protein